MHGDCPGLQQGYTQPINQSTACDCMVWKADTSHVGSIGKRQEKDEEEEEGEVEESAPCHHQ